MSTVFNRAWAMPSEDTFSVSPIGAFVRRYLAAAKVSVDPFARDHEGVTFTNDINPNTKAKSHKDAVDWLNDLSILGVIADLVILDPPYSPRQISDCYKIVGRSCGQRDTQNARLMKEVRNGITAITVRGSLALCFGWNSTGMGKAWETEEVLLVCHGGVHNDTICLAQRRLH